MVFFHDIMKYFICKLFASVICLVKSPFIAHYRFVMVFEGSHEVYAFNFRKDLFLVYCTATQPLATLCLKCFIKAFVFLRTPDRDDQIHPKSIWFYQQYGRQFRSNIMYFIGLATLHHIQKDGKYKF